MGGDRDMMLRSGDLDAVTESAPPVSRKDSATARLTEEEWTKILSAASKKNANIKRIADKYGIPRSTLRDRMKTGDTRPTTAALGRPTFFTAEQEEKVEKHLLYMADAGYALTHSQCMKLINSMCEEAGLDDVAVGPKLIRGFMTRHPDLVKRAPKKVNRARMAKFNRITVTKWFTAAEGILAQYSPQEMFNADDKFFDLETMIPRKVRSPHSIPLV
jgi:hypothetical protein